MQNPTAEEAIAVIDKFSGAPPGYRRGHARGLGLRGVFRARAEARPLTVAEHFQGGDIPCIVRFSNASAHPCRPDRASDKEGTVLGMAVRFELPSGKAATWAGINIAAFPARNPAEFLALTAVQAPGKNGKPNILRVLGHLIRHLHILASVKSIKALKPAASFSHETYRGIHTYFFVDALGARKPFRYEWIPRAGAASLSPSEAAAQPKLYLLDEIRARVPKAPLVWDLVAVLAAPRDSLDDPSQPWPEGRTRVTLGELTVDRVHEDQKAIEGMVFDPTGIVPGLALSDDPILKFRAQVYGASYERRTKEKRTEPAPADMGQ